MNHIQWYSKIHLKKYNGLKRSHAIHVLHPLIVDTISGRGFNRIQCTTYCKLMTQ